MIANPASELLRRRQSIYNTRATSQAENQDS